MKIAMGGLAVLAIIGGFVQIPGVTHMLDSFLEPTFADSELFEEIHPSVTAEWIGLAVGAVIGTAGIFIAWKIYGQGGNASALPGPLPRRSTRSSSTSGTSTR